MKSCRLIVLSFLILMLFAPLNAGQIQTLVPLPANLQGELGSVPYTIRVPGNWNGTLLVYAYGYAEASTPLAPPTFDVEALLAKGFAVAGIHATGTVDVPPALDAGWNVKERMQNTVALTAAFHGLVGRPQRTIMWGQSMGGLVTLGMVEKFPGLFDGAIALCPPAAGTPRRFDQALDVALAYKVAFPAWNDAWGTPGDLRDDLNFWTEVKPSIPLPDTMQRIGRWEFIRRVNRIPADTFYTGGFVQTLFFATGVRAELERRAGGPVAQNIGRTYSLSLADQTYLTALGVDWSALLAQMNEMTVFSSDRNARNFVEHYVNPTGRITRPVLTVHTEGDFLATPQHEGAYFAAVEDQGKEYLLMQQFVKGGGHCAFTSAQIFAGIDAMMYWLDTGSRPDPAVFFPTTLGFDLTYVPESWPW